jgi:Ca2+-binding RTX toxin-like protein
VHGGSGADGGEFSVGALMGDSPGMSVNSGRDGDDRIYGGDGPDTLYGFGGSDLLVGGDDTDYIFAEEFRTRLGHPGIARSTNPGIDTVSAGAGGDHIEAVDGRRDVIDCGGGKDAVWFDERLDTVSPDCELRNIIHSGG